MKSLPKRYDPKQTEDKIFRLWEEGGFFKPEAVHKKEAKPFVIVIPPPNITGSLHMGHALNSTVQDILIRKARMEGKPALWVPGTDHAGIATQNVVEKELKKEGKTRFDLGREKFIKRVWQWKEKYGHIIIDQLKKLGCSCEYTRERFTLDEDYSKAVKKAFLYYARKGWLYQGERVINWCPRCQTALSDIEVEYQQAHSRLCYIKYGPIILATTRPETRFGDTAIAVHPKDKRYKKYIGKTLTVNEIIGTTRLKVVADEAVDPKFATGAVKVTPAHDPVDFEIGRRHKLPIKIAIDKYGKLTKITGKFAGMDRFEAREKVVEEMKKMGLLEKVVAYQNTIPHCYRCGEVLEPLLSKQWFLKMDELKKPAIEVVKQNKIKFIPARWKKVYLDWMTNIKDWCVSRQIWWGHRLPVWESTAGKIYVGDNPPKGYIQVEDVLDTWFSSALWPFAVFGWPQKTKDLEYFYPTTVLCTAREILYLWVARMIFSGLEFMRKIPFKTVYIHPVVLAESGKRMSKSLGTGVDPLNLIEKYGADAVRFGIAWHLTGLQDLKFKEDAIVAARNFCNKLWNASRYVLSQNDSFKLSVLNLKPQPKTKEDRKILKELRRITKQTDRLLNNFHFGKAAQNLYHFFWREFCDKYIEASKSQIKTTNLKENTQVILFYTLVQSLKLLHPFIPFITEQIWQQLPGKKSALIISQWPTSY